MNAWLARATRWQLGVSFGLLCGLGTGVLVASMGHDGWAGFLPAALGAGIAGGLFGATVLRAQVRRQVEAVGVLPARARRAAGRASMGGAVPDDPDTRAAAYALARHALEEQGRHRLLGVLGSLVIVGMLVRLALAGSPWWWVGVVVVGAGFVYGRFVLPKRLRRRAALLRP